MLENIIRNTAKHASKLVDKNELPKKIIFTIRVRESSLNPDYYQVTIFDNVIVAEDNTETLSCSEKEYNLYYKDHCTSKSCSIFKLKKLIIDQNKLINEKVLNDENQLRTYALGLIEMEACASYLRGLELTEMDEPHFELKFSNDDREALKEQIKAGKEQLRILRTVNPLNKEGLELLKDNEGKELSKEERENLSKKLAQYDKRENCLGYQFYLPKPKELLVCMPEETFKDEFKRNASKNGITIVNKLEENKIYTETNLLSFSKITEDIKNSFLPKRKLMLTTKEDSFTKQKVLELLEEEKFKSFKEEVLAQLVIQKSIEKGIYPVFKGFKATDKGYLLTNKGFSKPKVFEELTMIYDDHGYNYIYNENGENLQIQTHKEKDFFEKINCLERKRGKKIKNKVWRLDYLYSALNNVVILDERIQEQAYNRYSLLKNKTRTKGVSYRELWYNQGCYIPTKTDIDLSSSNFSGYEEKLKTLFENFKKGILYLEAEKEEELIQLAKEEENLKQNLDNKNNIKGLFLPKPIYKGIDTVIIHIGVIEKILEADPKKSKNSDDDKKEFYKNLKEWSENPNLDIILTSGRAPKKVNSDYGFAGISVIMPHVIDQRFKHNLHQLILNIRPKNL